MFLEHLLLYILFYYSNKNKVLQKNSLINHIYLMNERAFNALAER